MTGNSGAGRELLSRRNFLVASGAVGVAGLAGCTENPSDGGDQGTTTGDSASLSGTINIAGSSTVFPLATQMKSAFQREYPDVKVNVQSTGTGGGFQNNFCPGNTDFNNASRPITDAERELCSKNGVEPVELKVATDALTVVVNNEAGWVDCITVDELAQIWSPENPPQRWSDVNADWPDETFNLFGPSQASGTFDYFTEVIVGEEGKSRTDYKATENDSVIIQGVSKNEYAMGYLGFAYYTENSDSVKALKVDAGDGCIAPSLETAKSGEYTPLSRPLFTYAAKSSLAEEHVAEFARFWIENSTSQELVAQNVGYVPNTEDEKAEMMDRLEAAIEEAQG
ncbi:phosphate ABC transporter substrate-binding protein PstS family protein [Salinirarus marinus]|uniref:PstS family phosphate ABC transporter substrate-binding protein n=1 Tax=Salinirarus marinus TaxID=3068310 RepID=UPI003C6C80EC